LKPKPSIKDDSEPETERSNKVKLLQKDELINFSTIIPLLQPSLSRVLADGGWDRVGGAAAGAGGRLPYSVARAKVEIITNIFEKLNLLGSRHEDQKLMPNLNAVACGRGPFAWTVRAKVS